MLALDKVNLRYERSGYRIENLSLQIVRGEFLGIIGESGCGKSTVGKLLMALINQSEWEYFGLSNLAGNLTYDSNPELAGMNLLDVNYKYLRTYRKHVQMIFQNPRSALNMNFSVGNTLKESIFFGATLDTKEAVHRRILELCEIIDLADTNDNGQFIQKKNSQLSGGQMKRVSIAKALAVEPDIIIADEPLTGLDASIRGKVLDVLFAEWNRRRDSTNPLTLIFITHDISLIAKRAERVIIMKGDPEQKRGQIIEDIKGKGHFRLEISADYHPNVNELIVAAQYFRADNT